MSVKDVKGSKDNPRRVDKGTSFYSLVWPKGAVRKDGEASL